MAICAACNTEIGSGGIVQENGAILCFACDAKTNKASVLPRATLACVGINLLIFLAMTATSGSFHTFSNETLTDWGADFGPDTCSKWQLWRLLSGSFLHWSCLHLISNMALLLYFGRLVELRLGLRQFIVLYLLSAIGASIASLWWNPVIVTAGASGAIMGCVGCASSFFNTKEKALSKIDIAVIALLIVFLSILGLTSSPVDNAGHIGGLATGYLLGWLFRYADTSGASWPIRIFGCAMLVTIFAAVYLTEDTRIKAVLKSIVDERKKAYNDYVRSIKPVTLSQDQEFNELFAKLADITEDTAPPVIDTDLESRAKKSLEQMRNLKPIDPEIAVLHTVFEKRSEALVDAVAAYSDFSGTYENSDATKRSEKMQRVGEKFLALRACVEEYNEKRKEYFQRYGIKMQTGPQR